MSINRFAILLIALRVTQGVVLCAFPITHTLLAEEWMALYGPSDPTASDEFVVGTLFPDIRYVAEEERANTHIHNATLQEVRTARTPFEQGKLLHCYVDDQREKWVVEWGVYELLVDLPDAQRASFLKLVEDEILYHEGVKTRISAFFHFPQEELAAGLPMNTLIKWHALLAGYFRTPPSQQLIYLKRLNQGIFHIPPEVVAEWATLLPEVVQRPEMGRYVNRLVNAFKEDFSRE